MQHRETLAWGLSGEQLCDEMDKDRPSILIVRRPQLTWRVIGYAETLGLRVKHIYAVVDDANGIFVVWRGGSEAHASILAWRKAERRLKLSRRAEHYAITGEARWQVMRPPPAKQAPV
jgi:hypothetical protein